MLPGDDLKDWISDRERQRGSRAATDRIAIDWSHGPVHRRFTDAFSNLPERSADAVVEAARSLFADDSWVDTLVGMLAEAMLEDPFLVPPFRHLDGDIHSGLVVFEDENISIAAGVSSVASLAERKTAGLGSGSIAFSGQVGVFKFVKAGGATLSFWEAPAIEAGFTAAAAGKCKRTGERSIADGDILVIDGRRESFVIERAQASLFILQASVKPERAPVSVEYDHSSGAYVGCSAADDSASRIQMIATLLRKLDCASAFETIAAFLDHRDFFVRWHVMRELLGIDADAAMPHLRIMAARDPHPEVRRTARALLDQIETPRPRRKAA